MQPSTSSEARRIRVLKFMNVFAIGGTERQVVNLVRGLDRSRFDLFMGCFRRQGEFLDEVVSSGVPVTAYAIRSFYDPRTLVQQFRLARFLRRKQIQVLHTYGFHATLFALPAAKLAGVPATVVSIRDMGELLSGFQRTVRLLCCRRADSVLVNADAIRTLLMEQHCSGAKIQVIRNGIILPKQDRSTSRALRSELGVPSDARLIAMIARLNRLKGVEYFLEAAAVLAPAFPDAHFLIIGDAPPWDEQYRTELQRVAMRLGLQGRITFAGFRTDVPQLLSELYVSVLPSLSEGLSNVLLESLAAGVPAVATEVGGNSEIVDHGVNGFLAPPRDSMALARGLRLLLENPGMAQCFGEAGKRKIRQQFSIEEMVRQTERHYVQLLGGAAGAHAEESLEAVA